MRPSEQLECWCDAHLGMLRFSCEQLQKHTNQSEYFNTEYYLAFPIFKFWIKKQRLSCARCFQRKVRVSQSLMLGISVSCVSALHLAFPVYSCAVRLCCNEISITNPTFPQTLYVIVPYFYTKWKTCVILFHTLWTNANDKISFCEKLSHMPPKWWKTQNTRMELWEFRFFSKSRQSHVCVYFLNSVTILSI
jgi:hypothetical protein